MQATASRTDELFEDVIDAYRHALAPGAEAALRKRHKDADRRGLYNDPGDVLAALVGFLEDESNPETRAFFRPGYVRELRTPLQNVLRALKLREGSARAIEAELADELFGLDVRTIANRVVGHLAHRDNWRHLARQPETPPGERKLLHALENFRRDLKVGSVEELAREWGKTRLYDGKPQHEVNKEVFRRLSKDPYHYTRHTRDGGPVECDDPEFFRPGKDPEVQAMKEALLARGRQF